MEFNNGTNNGQDYNNIELNKEQQRTRSMWSSIMEPTIVNIIRILSSIMDSTMIKIIGILSSIT